VRRLGIIIVVCALAGCSTAPRSPESLARSDLIVTDIQNAPPEYQLVYLDSGHFPRGNDVNALRIRYLLKELSEHTGDSPVAIADRTQRTTSVLRTEYGREVTNQRFLEEAKSYFDANGPKTNFNDLATLLALTMGR
jgi:hypothetical protein